MGTGGKTLGVGAIAWGCTLPVIGMDCIGPAEAGGVSSNEKRSAGGSGG